MHRGDNPLKRLHLTYEDIRDLTEEQLRELNLTEADRQDLIVEHMIAQNGGFYSLDRIMVDLFRQSREFPKRNTIVSRLYRMVAKGMIYNVPGKKGVYSTYEMSEQEAKKMFGNVDAESEEVATTESPAPTPTPATAHPSGTAKSKYSKIFMDSTAPARRA